MAQNAIPSIKACIFDVDGLLINSEDIYTDIYNNVLRTQGCPRLPWSVKARQQSRGAEVRPTPLVMRLVMIEGITGFLFFFILFPNSFSVKR